VKLVTAVKGRVGHLPAARVRLCPAAPEADEEIGGHLGSATSPHAAATVSVSCPTDTLCRAGLCARSLDGRPLDTSHTLLGSRAFMVPPAS